MAGWDGRHFEVEAVAAGLCSAAFVSVGSLLEVQEQVSVPRTPPYLGSLLEVQGQVSLTRTPPCFQPE